MLNMVETRLIAAIAVLLISGTVAGWAQPAAEPNLALALQWWKDMGDGWTPVGWKDHMFRFNVTANGTISAAPDINTRTGDWTGQGVQLTFYPSSGIDPTFGNFTPGGGFCDPRAIHQSWADCTAPVLCSDWSSDGIEMRQSVFAHIPDGGDISTGVEPLFAWVRISINEVSEGLPLEERYGFAIKVNAPHMQTHTGKDPTYPRALTAEPEDYDSAAGFRLVEPDGKVRLAIAAGKSCKVELKPGYPGESDLMLFVLMEVKKGAHVDMLVPMIPTERTIADQELAFGYDKSLAQANSYWARIPATAARFDVPEDYITQAIRRQLQMAQVVAERNPATGIYAMLTASWVYSAVWTTCQSLAFAWTMDCMGYHSEVEKYLKAFKDAQGTITPPGGFIKSHPGYFGSPKTLTSVDWLCDHGALLWAVSEHALLTGDRGFIEEWTPSIVKACEFIRDARRITDHEGVKGIMPPAAASDFPTVIQSVWNDGWMYKGLSTAVTLLWKTDHPRAAEFAAEARDYRETYRRAFTAKARTLPVWTDSKGSKHHFMPKSLFGEAKWETRSFAYLDCGPMMLVFSGLFDATDPEMRSALAWFREGPQTRIARYDANPQQVPCLFHEMSSAEPCYSWNVFHTWQLGDRQRFLEGMYSQFAGAIMQETYSICETRRGVMGFTPCLPEVYMARAAVVDDKVRLGELRLLRFMPLAWLRTDREAIFENVPTYYGPVTLRAQLAQGGRELAVGYSPRYRETPERVVLHVPPVKGLTRITLNGQPLKWDGKSATVVISGSR